MKKIEINKLDDYVKRYIAYLESDVAVTSMHGVATTLMEIGSVVGIDLIEGLVGQAKDISKFPEGDVKNTLIRGYNVTVRTIIALYERKRATS